MPDTWGSWLGFAGVAVGGAGGSVLRYAAQGFIRGAFPGSFPFGTLAVNLAGSLAIGALAALFAALGAGPGAQQARLFLMVGVLGGFTTFSSFSLETLVLLRAGEWRAALLYVLSSNAGGILLAFAGYALCRPLVARHLA